MKVIVSGAVLATKKAEEIPKLTQLLQYAWEGRHILLFEQSADLGKCLRMCLGAQAVPIYENAIEQAARDAARFPADAATVVIKPVTAPVWDDPVAELPLDDALALLAEPLGIFMEDTVTDSAFLLGMMPLSDRKRIQDAIEDGWVRFEHGGGSRLKGQIESRGQEQTKGLRVFALFDSDRWHPDELEPTWDGKGRCAGYETEQVARRVLPRRYWMLERRSIESYMPRQYLETVNRDAADAFFRLTTPGQWYFNMKKGFGRDAKSNTVRHKELYDTVSDEDRNTLNEGFGDTLAERYQDAASGAFDWDDEAREEARRSLPRLLRLL